MLLPLLLAGLPCFAHAHSAALPDCNARSAAATKACAQPIDHVVAITPGSFYTAKIGCGDCALAEHFGKEGAQRKHRIVKADYDLLLNVTLAHDKRAILINGQPVHPHIQTIPGPPRIYANQLRPTFSYANLSSALSCPNPYCPQEPYKLLEDTCTEWCYELSLGTIALDYLYMTRPTDYKDEHQDADAKYWEIALDAIGGFHGYMDGAQAVFDDPKQNMLRVIVAGLEAKTDITKDSKSGDSLFGSVEEEDKVYEYQIVNVSLQARAYHFAARKFPTLWQRVRIFFGMNIWERDGQLVYLYEEWGNWGKKGTLRNLFGEFVHWNFWYLFWIILPSTIGGLVVLYGLYRLVLLILQQRGLARWDGMDAVWEQVRRERTVEEENALLDGAYRDDPVEEDSAQPPHYTDEPQTMKPLPNKPLPEKPLPDVPLIDAE